MIQGESDGTVTSRVHVWPVPPNTGPVWIVDSRGVSCEGPFVAVAFAQRMEDVSVHVEKRPNRYARGGDAIWELGGDDDVASDVESRFEVDMMRHPHVLILPSEFGEWEQVWVDGEEVFFGETAARNAQAERAGRRATIEAARAAKAATGP
jgi:hypothetical protein